MRPQVRIRSVASVPNRRPSIYSSASGVPILSPVMARYSVTMRADKSRFRLFGRNWNFEGRSAEICRLDWGNQKK